MKKTMMALAIGCAAATIPAVIPAALAQTRLEQRRWDDAQRRFDVEQDRYEDERRIYEDARRRSAWRGGPPGGPRTGYDSGPRGGYDDYRTDYDASRYYRDDQRYTERSLRYDEQVYRGSDGRYYCKRNDGTTGLIIGGATGALLGNVIDGGRNRVGGTLIGGALGALLGRSVEQNSNNANSDYRCR